MYHHHHHGLGFGGSRLHSGDARNERASGKAQFVPATENRKCVATMTNPVTPTGELVDVLKCIYNN